MASKALFNEVYEGEGSKVPAQKVGNADFEELLKIMAVRRREGSGQRLFQVTHKDSA